LRHVVAVLAPGALYVIVLGLAGGLTETVQQLTMTSGPLLAGTIYSQSSRTIDVRRESQISQSLHSARSANS